MIEAVFERNGGGVRRVRIDGHAGYSERGTDIVCAAVSALCGGALNALEHYIPGGFSHEVDPGGCIRIAVAPGLGERDRDRVDGVLRTLELGVAAIAEEYPDHVKVRIGEERNHDQDRSSALCP